MTWNLFIDDERSPHEVFWADSKTLSRYHEEDWVIARTMPQVTDEIKRHGCLPSFISFDHDLGDHTKTGYDISKWIVDLVLDNIYTFPENFEFFVHSQNPVGKRNIESYMNGALEAIELIAEDYVTDIFNVPHIDESKVNITVGKIK